MRNIVIYRSSICGTKELGECSKMSSINMADNVPFFTDFLVRTPKKKCQARVPTTLMPPTFPTVGLICKLNLRNMILL